jgi:hypothetical protein
VSEFRRPFSGRAIGLSISESDESAGLGFPEWQVNRVTLQIVSALLGQGASVVFGHDWRDDGVMEAVHSLALRTAPGTVSESAVPPLLQNILPWPDRPRLSALDLERLASTVSVEQAGLPIDVSSIEEEAARGEENRTPLFQYCRARALTQLRRTLDRRVDARICLGGRSRGASGRYPGVIEEAFFAVQSRRPLFVAGLLGGAAAQVIDALRGRPMPDDFCPASPVTELYRHPPVATMGPIDDTGIRADRTWDRTSVWDVFQDWGIEGCARASGLTPAQLTELFDTRVLDRALQLVLAGLSSLFVREARPLDP